MMGEKTKLTKAMENTLRRIDRRGRIGLTVWAAGRPSCAALLRRGLVETDSNVPIGRFDGNPLVWVTPAGRAALAAADTSERQAKPRETL